SPAEDPGVPLRNLGFGWDRIFGFQARTTWDATQIFGIDNPGLNWDVNLDYYEERGPGIGTKASHSGLLDVFGIPVLSVTEANLHYVHDEGRDNLGWGRRNLAIESPHRGRAIVRNRLSLPDSVWMN